MTSSQGSPASPEKIFIAMLALLSCQVSASPIPAKYWAYLLDPPTFQVVSWNNEPIQSTQTNLSFWEDSILLTLKINILLILLIPSGD